MAANLPALGCGMIRSAITSAATCVGLSIGAALTDATMTSDDLLAIGIIIAVFGSTIAFAWALFGGSK
jgi:hypothetical protein